MLYSAQESIQDNTEYFNTPQLEDLFQSILREIDRSRPISCVIGYAKSGKTTFLRRLESALKCHVILVDAALHLSIKSSLEAAQPTAGDGTGLIQAGRSLVVLIDNAHLLADRDFAEISSVLNLARSQKKTLQFVLAGNGELVHRLARPANRAIYSLLGNLWNLPKLSREQALEYVRFLLGTSGMSQDLIAYPEALTRRAGGVIGILRMLTITLALKAIGSQSTCDARELIRGPHSDAQTDAAPESDPLPVQEIVARPPWIGLTLILTMGAFIVLLVVGFFWLIPGLDLRQTILSSFRPVSHNATASPPQDGMLWHDNSSAPAMPGPTLPAKTVFRKRTNEGPYSLQLGSYPTIEAMLLHLNSFSRLRQPLIWSRQESGQESFDLFAGRFESYELAQKFAVQHQLSATAVTFRPFVITVGPLTNQHEAGQAALLVGLPGSQPIFERELVTGVEIQIGLERSRDDAIRQCAVMEQRGLSCAITQYD